MNDGSTKTPVTIKKYANRRLYNTATSSYVTLENLGVMVKEGTEFSVIDAKTGEDLTHTVLTQIIVEEEGKSGQNLLPVGFLRQLISFYGDSMQWMVPKFLEQSMENLTKNQEEIRSYFQNTFGSMFPFGTTFEEMSKQNMALFEQTMSLFSSFAAMPDFAKMISMPGVMPTPCCKNSSTPCSSSTKEEPIVAPIAPLASQPSAAPSPATPTPTVTRLPSADSPEEMQQKISNLQKQLAELAKKRV